MPLALACKFRSDHRWVLDSSCSLAFRASRLRSSLAFRHHVSCAPCLPYTTSPYCVVSASLMRSHHLKTKRRCEKTNWQKKKKGHSRFRIHQSHAHSPLIWNCSAGTASSSARHILGFFAMDHMTSWTDLTELWVACIVRFLFFFDRGLHW